MRFLIFPALLLLLSSWTFGTALAAEVRCASVLGHYYLPQDEEWFKRRWPSGVRPTKSTCALGFIYGPITPGDYDKVRAFYRQNHPFLYGFSLASIGGNVMEAIKIGRFFREYLIQANAIVLEPECRSGCHSACNFDPLSWGIGVQN